MFTLSSPSSFVVVVGGGGGMFFGFVLFLFFSRDRVSLCIPQCPGIHSVDQAGLLKLRNLPASASQVLAIKVCHLAITGFLGSNERLNAFGIPGGTEM